VNFGVSITPAPILTEELLEFVSDGKDILDSVLEELLSVINHQVLYFSESLYNNTINSPLVILVSIVLSLIFVHFNIHRLLT
jgi:hypothetical protein